jgi:hypothetical protein
MSDYSNYNLGGGADLVRYLEISNPIRKEQYMN